MVSDGVLTNEPIKPVKVDGTAHEVVTTGIEDSPIKTKVIAVVQVED